ncbi:unnamed protein product [Paramecium pentaurelia]|uniref:Protein kinase domain-containing protein n=1 Tax=Paramecium pentaurelia TaxID=43138 RepID=A0A8S1XJ84_9CILI|nr:unnamed protein product [Paramecium pentaurelia]
MQSNYSPLYKIKVTLGPYIVYNCRVVVPSEIYLAYNTDLDRKCCVKIIEKKEESNIEKIVHQQIQLIVHQNITRIYSVIEQKNHIYIFQEICEKDLSKYQLDPSNFIQMLDFIYQISDGYITLQKNYIIHRDLKPENILIKEDLKQNRCIYKICDFGISKIEQNQRQQTHIKKGTEAYSAPEISQYQYSWAADAYSFGLILLEILLQITLNESLKKQIDSFLEQNRLKQWFLQHDNVKSQFKKLIILDQLNDSFKINPFLLEILDNLLVYQPEKRIQWEQLNILVKHQLKQLLKNPSVQNLKPKNIQEQCLPAVQLGVQNQLTSENSRLCYSLVTQCNQPQQQQYYNNQGMNQISNPQINNVQNIQQGSQHQFHNNKIPQQVVTPRLNGNLNPGLNIQRQSVAPILQINQPGNPQAQQRKN